MSPHKMAPAGALSVPEQFDMFDDCGVRMPGRHVPEVARAWLNVTVPGRPATPLILVNTENGHRAASLNGPPKQLFLDLKPEPLNVVRFIPRSHSAFMSKRVTSFFRSKSLYPGARHLAREKGILYLGDIARMTPAEFADALGRYVQKLTAFENELHAVGIFLNSRSPWWHRPSDYYA